MMLLLAEDMFKLTNHEVTGPGGNEKTGISTVQTMML